MIDKNGNKISIGDDESYDFEFALKEISFFMKQFKSLPSDDKAYSISKMIHQYLEKGGVHRKIYDAFYELESYAKDTRNDSFVWNLVYIRRIFSEWENSQKHYEDAFAHEYVAAKHFDIICSIRPTFHNRRVRVCELASASEIAIDSKKTYMTTDKYREPVKRAIELLCELDSEAEAENNIGYWTTGKLVWRTEAIFMERLNQNSGEEWLDVLKRLIYYARGEYRLKPDSSYMLEDLAIFYKVALRCDGYASLEVLAEIDKVCALAESANDGYMNNAIEKIKKVREICFNAIKPE